MSLLCDPRQVSAHFWALVPVCTVRKAEISKFFWNSDT